MMEASSPVYSYKEIRLDLDSPIQGSDVVFRLPPTATSAALSRTTQKRTTTTEISIAEDEIAFRRQHVATAASVYHRRHHTSPRSFLWQVLDGGRVLSVRAVDVSKQRNTTDTYITLRLIFPHPILPLCITLADSKDHDVLSVFVLTQAKALWTLNLRLDQFRRSSNIEQSLSDWCKSYTPNALGIKRAHRLAALTADELLISLHDGSLVRLFQPAGGDGSVWKEQHYSEGGWGVGIRSLISFQGSNSIRYGDYNVDLSAATSIASPVTLIGNVPYAFTVSLDHQLRVWNLSTSRLAYREDILVQGLTTQDESRKVIDPTHSQLVKVINNGDEGALCVTYSPLGAGQFKFWIARAGLEGSLDLEDLLQDNTLIPQAPSTDIWTMADFGVVLEKKGIEHVILWVLWKNNVTYRLHKLKFITSSTSLVNEAWRNDWEAMTSEVLCDSVLPIISSRVSSDGTDKWLDFILMPGRFSKPTLETALSIYEQGLGAKLDKARKGVSLADRMCTAISSTVALSRNSNGDMDYGQFRLATDTQWRRFFRLIEELDKQRGEAMSLVIDPEGKMPWVVLADGISAIRDCTSLERIWHNINHLTDGSTEFTVSKLLCAASIFSDMLSESFVNYCDSMLLDDIFQAPSHTETARMRTFYERCDYANQVGDEEYIQLRSNLGGDFSSLSMGVYSAMLDLMSSSGNVNSRQGDLPPAEYGNKLMVRGVQEIVELHRRICLEQTILLIFVEGEVNNEEEDTNLDSATVFNQLMSILKRLELIKWLCSTEISLPLARTEHSASLIEKTFFRKTYASFETITVFEGIFRHLLDPGPGKGVGMSSIITNMLLHMCIPDSEYSSEPLVIQCFLLKHGRADLAMEFSRFLDQDPCSTYIQGRAYLAANDAVTASTLFKKAAFGMGSSNPGKRSKYRFSGYLDETEKSLLSAGLPEYYSHIVALYDKEKHFSFVIDFARLALQFIKTKGEVQSSNLRTDMHSRLFNAAIQTAQYDVAHSILGLFRDSALQASSLRILITRMCESSHAFQLIDLPFIGLHNAIDQILSQKCQGIVDLTAGVPYHKILYAWRIKRSDFRGAAAISFDRLRKLQQSGEGDKSLGEDTLETPVTKQYISLINALICVDPQQAWIVSEESSPQMGNATKADESQLQTKRQVITLADVRKSYQQELDRIAAIQNNQFAFAGGEEMEVL